MTIEERAKEAGIVSQYKSDYRYDTRSVESGYMQGATEQKVIDDERIKKLYEAIEKSKWFADSYKGKSLGEFIEVES